MAMQGAARRGMLGVLILWLVTLPNVLAQIPPPSAPLPIGAPVPRTFQPAELHQLLAPIALYPDALVAQILMAATYPLEVVLAARWVRAHPHVTGPQLEEAMQQQPWDPSVKSLTAFPQVLAMMDAHLDWTQKLGDAFLAQQENVLATVQTLRAKAQAAGTLQSTPQQTVIVGPQDIRIEPASPEVVYVPLYNPMVVYGPWWEPAFLPYLWHPPGYVVGVSGISFGIGVVVGAALWGGCDWHHHHVIIGNRRHFNTFNRTTVTSPDWHHAVRHRRGVPYADPGVRQHFGQGPLPGAAARGVFRGHAPEAPPALRPHGPIPPALGPRRPMSPALRPRGPMPPAPQAIRPPAAFEGLGRGGEVRNFSDRGRTSRLGPGGGGHLGGRRGRHR